MIPNMDFELLMHAAFVADEIWGFMLEPARTLRYKYTEKRLAIPGTSLAGDEL